MKRSLGLLFLCSILFSCAHGGPPDDAQRHNISNSVLSSWIRFYRGPLDHLQAVRAGHCPMYPSDSAYSLQALQKHGFAIGMVMMFDRLMRCGRDEVHLSPHVLVNGGLRTYDPVENNDFWWYRYTVQHAATPLGPRLPAAVEKAAPPPAPRKLPHRSAGNG